MVNETLHGFDEWFGCTDWRVFMPVEDWYSYISKIQTLDSDEWIIIEPITIQFKYTENQGVIDQLFDWSFDDDLGDSDDE